MQIKKEAHDEVVKIVQTQLDEVRAKIRNNKRTINQLAAEQAKLKKVRLEVNNLLRTINGKPIINYAKPKTK